jgi:hypothetical protein
VEAVDIGVEDDASVEQRTDSGVTCLHVSGPKLEVALVLVLPVFVQVDKEVDPAT